MKSYKIAIILVFILLSTVLVACNNIGSTPVYQGMVVSDNNISATNLLLNSNGYESYEAHSVYGDYNGRENFIDQERPFKDSPTIGEKIQSTLLTEGGEARYYADKNQDVFINIKIDNPKNFEILSFILNDVKYSSYMFERGSNMENIFVKVNSGLEGGIIEYTIDALKYVDGTKIKDVKMKGDKTVKIGVRADDLTYVSITNQVNNFNSLSFQANLVDKYNLIKDGYAKAVLYDGNSLVNIVDLSVGENEITFDNLTSKYFISIFNSSSM